MSYSAPPNGKWPASQVPKRAPLPNGLPLHAYYDPPLTRTPDPLSAPAQLQSSVTPPIQPLRHAEPSPVRAARGLGQEGTQIRVSDIVALESWAEQQAQNGLGSADRTPQGVDSAGTPQLLLSPPDIRTSSNPWPSASSVSTPTTSVHTPRPRRSDIGLSALEERLNSLTPEHKDQDKFASFTHMKDPPWHQIRLRPVPNRKATKSPPRPLEHAVGPRARMTKATAPVTGQLVPGVAVRSSAVRPNTMDSDVAAQLAQQFSPDVLSEALRLHKDQVKAPAKPSWPPPSTLATATQAVSPPNQPSYLGKPLSSSPMGQSKLRPPIMVSPSSSTRPSRTPSPDRTTRPAVSSPKGPRPSRVVHSPPFKPPASVRQLASQFTSAEPVTRASSQSPTGNDKAIASRPPSGLTTVHTLNNSTPSASSGSSSAKAEPQPPLAAPLPAGQGKVSARVHALCSEAASTPLQGTPPNGTATIPATKPSSSRRPPPSALGTKLGQASLKQPTFRSPTSSSASSPSTSPLCSGVRSVKMSNPQQVAFNLPSSPDKSCNDPAPPLAIAAKPLRSAVRSTQSPGTSPRLGRHVLNASLATDTRASSNKASPGIRVSSSVLNLVRAVEDGEKVFRATSTPASGPVRTSPESEPREPKKSSTPSSPQDIRPAFRPPLRPTQASSGSTQRASESNRLSSPSRQAGVRTTTASPTKPPSAFPPSTAASPTPSSNLNTKPIRPSWAFPRREPPSSASSQSDGPDPPGASHAPITTKVSSLRNVWERT